MTKKTLWATAAVAALALATPAPHASAQTFIEALEIAVRTSPDIMAQREALRQLDENVAQARAGMRPTVNGSISTGINISESSESPIGPRERYPTSIGVSASQPLFDGWQTENAVDSANASVESGRQQLRNVEQTVLLDAITAYIRLVQAHENVRLARNNLELNQASLQAARDRFEVGEVTRTDVAQAETAVAESQANLASQQGALRQARESFFRRVGVEPSRLARLPSLPELPNSLEEAREIARRNHPRVLAAKADVVAAGYSVEQAKGATLPQVGLSGSVNAVSDGASRNSGSWSSDASIDVTVPIFQGGVLRSRVRQNQALEDQRFQQLRSSTRITLEEVGVAWETLVTSRATIRSNASAVRAQQIVLAGVQEEARVGSRTTLDVLDAQQRLLNSQVALLNAQTDQQINAYSLLAALGLLSVETLKLDVAEYDVETPYQAAQEFNAGFSDEGRDRPDDWLTTFEH